MPSSSSKSVARWLRPLDLAPGILLLALGAASASVAQPSPTQPPTAQYPEPARPSHGWAPDSTESLAERFPPPPGFARLPQEPGSFGAWARGLPLRPRGTPVKLFDGRVKPVRAHAAVLDIDTGSRDLQQCADAVIRLRAEYLFARRCDGEIAFDFTSGDRARWSAWAAGNRPRVEGDRVSWSRRASPDASYASFRRYLSAVFTYAGTYSLARELERVEDPARALPGDVFVQGGFPGHAVVVLDVAESLSGSRRLLLAQSYMPAQDLHVLVGPGGSVDPWYPALAEGTLETPEWRFDYRDLRRFPSATCSGEHPEESSDAGGELLEVGGDVLPPRPAPGNRLNFLAPGCNRPLHGVLVARLVVEKSGEASSIELLKVPGDGCLAEALRQQLDGWRFTPATRDGEPVRVHYHLSTTIHPR